MSSGPALAALALCALGLAAASAGQEKARMTSPIDELVQMIAALDDGGLWTNGLSPDLRLPPEAAEDQVVDRYFASVSFDAGKVKSHRVLESKRVSIHGADYSAVRVATDQGPWIILFRHEGGGWWIKLFRPGQDLGPPARKARPERQSPRIPKEAALEAAEKDCGGFLGTWITVALKHGRWHVSARSQSANPPVDYVVAAATGRIVYKNRNPDAEAVPPSYSKAAATELYCVEGPAGTRKWVRLSRP